MFGRRWAGASADTVGVDDHRHVFVAAAGVPPYVLIHTKDPQAVQPVQDRDQDPNPEPLLRPPTHHGVTRPALVPAPPAPLTGLHNTAGTTCV